MKAIHPEYGVLVSLCCQCQEFAYVGIDEKWYCTECYEKRAKLGEWADLVELIEEASNERPDTISLHSA